MRVNTQSDVAKDELQAWSDSGLLDQIDIPIYAVDAQGICRRFNAAAEQLFEYTQAEMLGRNIHSQLHSRRPDGSPYPQEECTLLQTIRSGQSKTAMHEVMWSASGQILPLECSVSRIRMEGGYGAVVTSKDLRPQQAAEASVRSMMEETTEMLRQRDAASRVERELALAESIWQSDLAARMEQVATDKLREQQDLLSHVVNATSIGIAVLDGQLRFRWYNRAYQHLTRLDEGQRSLTGESWLESFPATAEMRTIAEDVLRTRQPFSTLSYACDGFPEGQTFWNWSLTPLSGEDLLLTVQDVTGQTLAQRALVQSDKMAAVGRLAASISHEINNPLEAVTNLLYLIHNDEALSEESQRYVEMAEVELARVSQIASQTLRFHRHSPEAVARTPQQLVDPVLALYQGKLKNSQVAVSLDYDRAVAVTTHEGDIRQILNNLIGNAIDAMDRGGNLKVRTRSHHCVRTGRAGLRITISDTGHGMSPETAQRIFEPFYTTKGSGGSGLGLWISHTLAERHGGTLKVRSCKHGNASGKAPGTTFSLFVPSESEAIQ